MSTNNKGVSHQAITVLEYIADANAQKVSNPVLCVGTVPASAAPESVPILVGIGNLIRIRTTGTSSIYIAFGASTAMGQPSVTTTPAIELFGAGVWLINATDNFMASSAALARIEIVRG